MFLSHWLRGLTGRRSISRSSRRRRPHVSPLRGPELLEERTLLTSILYLDYGDSFPVGGLRMTVAQLRQPFASGGIQGPNLLAAPSGFGLAGNTDTTMLRFTGLGSLVDYDYNNDTSSTIQDYLDLRADVLSLVQRYYGPFDVDVRVAPTLDNTTSATYRSGIQSTMQQGANVNGEYDGWIFVSQVTNAATGNPVVNLNGLSVGVDIAQSNTQDDVGLAFADAIINKDATDDTRLAYTIAHEAAHDFGLEHKRKGINRGITGVNTGPAGSASFLVSGDITGELFVGEKIVLSGSTGNDGAFTVRAGSSFNSMIGMFGQTTVNVVEAINNATADGTITDGPAAFLLSQSELVVGSANSNSANRTNLDLFTRFPLLNDSANPAVSNADTLLNTNNLGPRVGSPPAYVTGTGAFDEIEIVRTIDSGEGQASVIVQPHRDNSFSNPIGIPYTYPIDYRNGIVVDAGFSDDRIIIDARIAANVVVRGMAGNDELELRGTNLTREQAVGSYQSLGTAVGLDGVTSFLGTVTAGFTTVTFSEFEPAGRIVVKDLTSFTFFTPGDTQDQVTIRRTDDGDEISGFIAGVRFVPLVISGVTQMNLNLGTQNDTVSLGSYSAATLWTVNAGNGDDSLLVSPSAFDLDWLETNSNVRFRFFGDAGANDRILIFNSSALQSAQYAFLPPESGQPAGIHRTGRGWLLGYESVDVISFSGSDLAQDEFLVKHVPAGTRLSLFGGGEDDVFEIGGGSYIDNILGPVSVNGGMGRNELTIEDSDAQAGIKFVSGPTFPLPFYVEDTYTFESNTFQKRTDSGVFEPSNSNNGPLLTFSALSELTLNASGTTGFEFVDRPSTTVEIHGVTFGTSLTVNGNDGAEKFVVHGGGDVRGGDYESFIRGPVALLGGNGDDELEIDDRIAGFEDRYILGLATVNGVAGGSFTKDGAVNFFVPTLEFAGVVSVKLDGGAADNTFGLQGARTGMAITVNGNDGDDEFVVGGGNYAANIRGAVTIDGGGGDDIANIEDGDDVAGLVDLGDDAPFGTNPIVGNRDVYTFNATTFVKREEDVGPHGTFFFDTPTLTFDSIAALALQASGTNGDPTIPDSRIEIDATAAGTHLTVSGNGGADVFNIGNGDFDTNVRGPLTIDGGDETDTINLNDLTDGAGGDTYTFDHDGTSSTMKKAVRTLTFEDVEDFFLDASPNDDTIDVNGLLETVRLVIDGNGGRDHLTMAVPDRLNNLWVRDGGDGWTSISAQSIPTAAPDVLRFIDVEIVVLDGSAIDTGFGVTLEAGSLNARDLTEFTIVGGPLYVQDHILEGPATDALLRVRKAAGATAFNVNHFVSGTAARLEIDMHDHDGDVTGPFNTGRAYDAAGNIVYRFEEELVGTVRILGQQTDVRVTLDGTTATLDNAEFFGRGITGANLSSLNINATTDGRLRLLPVADMTIDILDTLFPNFEFAPIFGLDVSPLGTFHVYPVNSTRFIEDISMERAVLRANDVPAGGYAAVFFAIPALDSGFRDLDGDGSKDAFVMTPAFSSTLFRDDMILNGASQQLYTGDTNPFGPEIVLDGAFTTNNALTVFSDNSFIHGLGIHSFNEAAVVIGGSGNTVSGNYIGVDPTGTFAPGNGGAGVFIAGGSDIDPTTGNLITDNLISGNEAAGVTISGDFAFDNVVSHNRIGTDRSGASALGNAVGVSIQFAQGNVIEANQIAGNGVGVHLSQFAGGNLIQNNEIGAAATGVPGNTADGVLLEGAFVNDILDNVIAGNGGNGVTILGGFGNRLRNSTYSNAGLGIDLGGDGVTPNDLGDGDAGPNDLQNYPELLSAQSAALTRVVGTINSTPNTSILLDFFANASLDASGFGEGQRWLASQTITTDDDGNASFDYLLNAVTVVGERITATATGATFSTSEFSGGVPTEEPTFHAVTNTNDSGPGSLRDAIQSVNQFVGADQVEILFAIPETDPNYVDVDSHLPGGDAEADVFVISPQTALPALTRGNIVINGQSQQNATGDRNPFGPEIMLSGDRAVGAEVQSGLISRYQFEGSAADVAGDNEPVADAGLSFVDGRVGQGVTFQPGGYIDIPHTEELARQVFTLSAWVRPDGPGPNDDFHGSVILAKGLSPALGGTTIVSVELTYSTQLRRFLFGFGDFFSEETRIISADKFAPGEFHHVAATYDGATFRLYVDGTLQGQKALAKTIDYDATIPWTIGSTSAPYRGVGFPRTWNGVIDEVGIYDRPLTAGEIATLAAPVHGLHLASSNNRVHGLNIQQFSGDGVLISGQPDGSLNGVLDKSAFFAATGAQGVADYENLGLVPENTYTTTDGKVSITAHGLHVGALRATGVVNDDWTLRLAGPDLAAGLENFSFDLASPAYAFGFEFVEPHFDPNVNVGAPVDSTFHIVLKDGATEVGSFTFNAPDDTASFVGATSSIPFDRVEMVEIVGNQDNEFIGRLYIGHTPPAADDNTLTGNYIGTNATGDDVLGNGGSGVSIDGSSNNVIGGTDFGAGNVISGNALDGVRIINSVGDIVQGNLIGTDRTGTLDRGNGRAGIIIANGGDQLIGGATDEARNVISGNTHSGIELLSGPSNVQIVNNYIGTNAGGDEAVPNSGPGVSISARETQVLGNLISGNVQGGVVIGTARDGNVLQGNIIGLNAAGTDAIPNLNDGVSISVSSHNVIGGATEQTRNIIAGNAGHGVRVESGTGNTIRRNSIHSNVGLGIDLGGDGPTPNDNGDPKAKPVPILPDTDAGPNELQNGPEIKSASLTDSGVRVVGQLWSTPGSTFTIDFYAGAAADPSGFGEGQRWLDAILVTTDADGFANINHEIAGVLVDEFITATATNANGSTSEFSNARVVRGRPTRDGARPGNGGNLQLLSAAIDGQTLVGMSEEPKSAIGSHTAGGGNHHLLLVVDAASENPPSPSIAPESPAAAPTFHPQRDAIDSTSTYADAVDALFADLDHVFDELLSAG
jgi:hypothetical protein